MLEIQNYYDKYRNIRMKVLVTGGYGLVGKALQNKNNRYIYIGSEYDLRIESEVLRLFEKYNPDVVIHLANVVSGLYNNINNNYSILIDNVKMNINILEMCKRFKIKRLIGILSTCVFGNNVDYPLTSSQILKDGCDESNEGYGTSKRLLYTGSKLLSKTSDIEIVSLIPTNLYGFEDNYNLEKSHVIPGLIMKMYISGKDSVIIKGTGESKRQFVFANDFAEIIEHFVDCTLSKKYNELIVSDNVESEITIKELVNKISKELNYKGEIKYDKTYSNGQLRKTASEKELLEYIPNFKFTNLDKGLKETVNYFLKNYESIRK